MTQAELDEAKLQLERQRLEIQSRKLNLEEMKAEREKGIRGFISHNLPTVITALVSFITVVISASQVWIAQINKEKDIAILREQQAREWNYKALEFVANRRELFFGENKDETVRMAKVVAAVFPKEISEPLLSDLEKTVDSPEVKEAISQVRSRINAYHRIPKAPRDIRTVILHATNGTDKGDVALFKSNFSTDNRVSYHYLIHRTGEIIQSVDEDNIAIHVGGDQSYNNTSIGVALSHRFSLDTEEYSAPQRAAMLDLLTEISSRHQIDMDNIMTHAQIDPLKRGNEDKGLNIEQIREEVHKRLQRQ